MNQSSSQNINEGGLEAFNLAIREQFPAYADWVVACLATELDELDSMEGEIFDAARQLENDEGYFLDDALKFALERATVTVKPPSGHLFVRVTKEGEKPVLLTIRQKKD